MKKNKVCFLSGEIDWDTAGKTMSKLYEYYLMGNSSHKEPLLLIIASPGGETDAAWSLYATLKNLGPLIATLASGRLSSAGVFPFLAGEKRFAFPESVFLFHPTFIDCPEKEKMNISSLEADLQNEKHELLCLKDVLSTIVARTDIVDRLTDKNESVLLSADQALNCGLVTEIVTDISKVRF